MTFSSRLKKLRLSKEITQPELAKSCNLSLRVLQYYEAAQQSPTLEPLVSLADYFDVSIDYLVGRTDDPRRR